MKKLDFEITDKGTLRRLTSNREEHAPDTVKVLCLIEQRLANVEKLLALMIAPIEPSQPDEPSLPVLSSAPVSQDEELIDFNTASFEVLMLLKGVGEITAQRIIENRPYKSLAQVKRTFKDLDWDDLSPLVTV